MSAAKDELKELGARPKEYGTSNFRQSSSSEEQGSRLRDFRPRDYRPWPKKASKGKGKREYDSWGRKYGRE